LALRVDWALVCRYGEVSADGTATLVGAGMDALLLEEVPSEVGVFLMLRVAGQPDEFEEAHELAVTLIDPERDERELLSISFGPMEGPPPFAEPGMDVGLPVPTALGWEAEHFGLYTFEVRIDGRRQRSIPILVRNVADIPGGTGTP
jgi:hypothetical protein